MRVRLHWAALVGIFRHTHGVVCVFCVLVRVPCRRCAACPGLEQSTDCDSPSQVRHTSLVVAAPHEQRSSSPNGHVAAVQIRQQWNRQVNVGLTCARCRKCCWISRGRGDSSGNAPSGNPSSSSSEAWSDDDTSNTTDADSPSNSSDSSGDEIRAYADAKSAAEAAAAMEEKRFVCPCLSQHRSTPRSTCGCGFVDRRRLKAAGAEGSTSGSEPTSRSSRVREVLLPDAQVCCDVSRASACTSFASS